MPARSRHCADTWAKLSHTQGWHLGKMWPGIERVKLCSFIYKLNRTVLKVITQELYFVFATCKLPKCCISSLDFSVLQ